MTDRNVISSGDAILGEIADHLIDVKQQLGQVLARLPEPAVVEEPEPAPDEVEVRGADAPAAPRTRKAASKPRARKKQ